MQQAQPAGIAQSQNVPAMKQTESATQFRHAKLQARFSGNDKSGKGLQQLGHVYVLAVIDTRTAEARCVDLKQAERACANWAMGAEPWSAQVSGSCRQRALAVKAVRVLNCQSVHSVAALLGPACWGQGASQKPP